MTLCILICEPQLFEGMCCLYLQASPEAGGSIFLRNMGNHSPIHKAEGKRIPVTDREDP
jgi:hypothetical protein